MNRFAPVRKRLMAVRKFPIAPVIFILIMGAFIYGVSTVSKSKVMNEKELLEDALQRDIVHCYAVEGMYPPSIRYIEEHYGLIYDKEKFIISYVNEGDNIAPSVIIIER